jgi:hypothetical protein
VVWIASFEWIEVRGVKLGLRLLAAASIGLWSLVVIQQPDTALANSVAQRAQSVIDRLVDENPGAKWITQRSSSYLARRRVPIEQELCNFEFATSLGPQAPMLRRLIQSMERGEVRFFVQNLSATCGMPLQIQATLDRYFEVVARTQTVIYDAPVELVIYRVIGLRAFE